MLAFVGGIGYVGLKALGVINDDYTDAAGTGDVVVQIPEGYALSQFGQILEDNDVVASAGAFVNAADGQALSGGFYKLRRQIPASTAVEMMTDGVTNRVGRMVVSEGLQLESKEGIDGRTTVGIFDMISAATTFEIDGVEQGVSTEDLMRAAAEGTVAELGIPDWAQEAADKLEGDYRRIEGLIAPGTWEYIDPSADAMSILNMLIAQSAMRFQQGGLLDDNDSGLTPYETLIAASIVEREAQTDEDFAKVSRVILNRLDEDQRLEMDSTANYTAAITNIDVFGDAFTSDTEWNTYRFRGLPITPIGAVGERALYATEHPADGPWLYFVTIDSSGTTLFAETYPEHERNRDKACANGFLSTNCD